MCRVCGKSQPVISPHEGVPVSNYRYLGGEVYASICKRHELEQSKPVSYDLSNASIQAKLHPLVRYAKVNKMPMDIKPTDVKAVYNETGYRCAICRSPHDLKPALKLSVTDGGKLNPDNLTVLCDQCNLHHHSMSLNKIANLYWFTDTLLYTINDVKIIDHITGWFDDNFRVYKLTHVDDSISIITAYVKDNYSLFFHDGMPTQRIEDFGYEDINFDVVRYWFTRQGYQVTKKYTRNI